MGNLNMFTQEVNDILFNGDPVGVIFSEDQSDEYWCVADYIQREHFAGEPLSEQLVIEAICSCFGIGADDVDQDKVADAYNQIVLVPLE